MVSACHRSAKPTADVVPPTLISGQSSIPYPPDLFARHIEGEVLLYLFIDSSGTVVRDSVRVARSSGQASFDAAALEAATRLHFSPARRGPAAFGAPIQIPIRFTRPDSIQNARAHP